MDEKAIQTITEILKRGNNAIVRKKGNGFVIEEEKKKIKYQTTQEFTSVHKTEDIEKGEIKYSPLP